MQAPQASGFLHRTGSFGSLRGGTERWTTLYSCRCTVGQPAIAAVLVGPRPVTGWSSGHAHR